MTKRGQRRGGASSRTHSSGRTAFGAGRLRVIAGELRGRFVETLDDRRVRPMPERMRGAVFNALDSRGWPNGAHVWDMFAGTGMLGIESLSRGARFVTFTERDPEVARRIERSLVALAPAEAPERWTSRARVQLGDALRTLPLCFANPAAERNADRSAAARELWLVDPPYPLMEAGDAADAFWPALNRALWAARNAVSEQAGERGVELLTVVGHDKRFDVPESLAGQSAVQRRTYGRTAITCFGAW